MKYATSLFLTGLCCLCMVSNAWSLGTEDFGNDPIDGGNYENWTGVMSVINDKHRVYHWWVNGNEQFFYEGNTDDANVALKNFSQIKAERLDVILRPGPGITKTFDRKSLSFNWNLHLVGGIAAGMQREDRGELIWVTHPVLTLYVGGEIKLEELVIPAGVNVLQLSDLQARYSQALESSSRTVRGWACGHISELDRFNSAAMYRIAKVLTDEDPWVRLNAAGAIATFGAKAKPAIKQVQAAIDSGDQQLSKRATETLEKIESATDDPISEIKHVAIVKAITVFCEQL